MRRRGERFELCLSTAELTLLRHAARVIGVPTSELVREAAVEVARSLVFKTPAVREAAQ